MNTIELAKMLMANHQRRSHSGKDVAKIIRDINERGNIQAIAIENQVSEGLVYKVRRQYKIEKVLSMDCRKMTMLSAKVDGRSFIKERDIYIQKKTGKAYTETSSGKLKRVENRMNF